MRTQHQISYNETVDSHVKIMLMNSSSRSQLRDHVICLMKRIVLEA